MSPYRAPAWLPGGHAQTIWPVLRKGAPPPYRRERWDTPDGDFIDVDLALARAGAPTLVLFHGLEGSSASHYAQAFAAQAAARSWSVVLPHFRGCSGELNLAPRAYHSGDFEEIGWMLAQAKAAAGVVETLARQDIIAGVPVSRLRPADKAAENLLLVAVTETVTPADIEAFATALSKVLS